MEKETHSCMGRENRKERETHRRAGNIIRRGNLTAARRRTIERRESHNCKGIENRKERETHS
jgi:hypothetical protein